MRFCCRLIGRSGWGRLRRLFLFEVDDGGRKRLFFGKDGEAERSDHEHDRDDDGEFAQKIRRAAAPENRLARPAEGRPDFGSLTGLQEDGANHEKAGDDVNDDHERMHETPISELTYFSAAATIVANEFDLRQAPPTRAPSIPSADNSASAFCGVTLPPYKILIPATVS